MRHRGCLSVACLLVLIACQSGPAPSSLPFRDGFDDPNSGWTKVDTSQLRITYQDGALHFTIDALDSTAWAVAGVNAADFILDVDATQVEGPDDNHYGVIVRYADDKNFYRLDISGDGFYSISRYTGGVWTMLVDWKESDAIQQGATTNHLRVIAEGPALRFVVNGTPVGEISDADIPAGDVGLTAGTFFNQAGVHVAFDNFEVNPLPQASPQP